MEEETNLTLSSLAKCKKIRRNLHKNGVTIKYDHCRIYISRHLKQNRLLLRILDPEIKENPTKWVSKHGTSNLLLALSNEGVEALFVALTEYLSRGYKEEQK